MVIVKGFFLVYTVLMRLGLGCEIVMKLRLKIVMKLKFKIVMKLASKIVP
jgi:hypothetical protein